MGFPYSAFLLASQIFTHRLPARSPVRCPSSQVPPSPAFKTQTPELPGTPGLRSQVLSCGWSQTLACDGAGHHVSLRSLFMRLIPALIHREVHTIAYESMCQSSSGEKNPCLVPISLQLIPSIFPARDASLWLPFCRHPALLGRCSRSPASHSLL